MHLRGWGIRFAMSDPCCCARVLVPLTTRRMRQRMRRGLHICVKQMLSEILSELDFYFIQWRL